MSVKYIENLKGIKWFENALDNALEELSQEAVSYVQDITPRDLKRPPKNLNAKVTGSLKRSIWYERSWKFKYKVWSKMWAKNTLSWEETNNYWFYLEFWTKFMKPRSFLRKWIYWNLNKLQKFLEKKLKNKLK